MGPLRLQSEPTLRWVNLFTFLRAAAPDPPATWNGQTLPSRLAVRTMHPCRARSSGHDAGKKIKGKKRQILVDTMGLLFTPSFIPRFARALSQREIL